MSNYWADRFNTLQDKQLKKAERSVIELEMAYNKAIKGVERDMSTWYSRFASNNQIDITEAQKLLKDGDLAEFKWTLDEYTKHAKANAFDPKYIKQLENASARVHVTRLEAIELQLRQKVEALSATREQGLTKLSRGIFEERYYKTAYETQLGLGLGWDVARLNNDLIDNIISKPWAPDGINFSKRIWRDRDVLVNTLHQELTQSIIRGDGPGDVINLIASKMGASRKQAGRLVMTESAFFASAGQKQAFEELDVEQFEIVATLDGKTSDLCQGLDGTVVPMTDFAPGITAPPFHTWCRSTTIPYFEDLGGERIARDEDGKTYMVPADTTYKQWKENFVDNGDKAGLKPADPNATATPRTPSDKIQAIKDRILAEGGTITEDHIQEAGRVLMDDQMEPRQPWIQAVEDKIKERDALGMSTIEKNIMDTNLVIRGLAEPAERGFKDATEAWDVKAKLMQDKGNLMEKWSGLDKEVTALKAKASGSTESNIQDLRDRLGKVRPVGSGSVDLNAHLNKSRSPVKKVIMDAYQAYPTEWVELSAKRGGLTPQKVDRGYYNGSWIGISGYSEASQLKTALHELGHRFEDAIPGIKKAEKVFYDRRTAGEVLKWMGSGYARDEVTRVDKFLDSYMGKDYKGTAYEIVSMGFELAYVNPTYLWKDPDYARFIYGILALF
jgi:SPP1 gp7 family putative phage head morphogenesis protein